MRSREERSEAGKREEGRRSKGEAGKSEAASGLKRHQTREWHEPLGFFFFSSLTRTTNDILFITQSKRGSSFRFSEMNSIRLKNRSLATES